MVIDQIFCPYRHCDASRIQNRRNPIQRQNWKHVEMLKRVNRLHQGFRCCSFQVSLAYSPCEYSSLMDNCGTGKMDQCSAANFISCKPCLSGKTSHIGPYRRVWVFRGIIRESMMRPMLLQPQILRAPNQVGSEAEQFCARGLNFVATFDKSEVTYRL